MNALDQAFSAVLSASWHVSWLIVVVLLLRPIVRRHIPAQLLFATWIIVALGLLIPFGVPVRWSPFNLAKPISPLAPNKTAPMPVSMPVAFDLSSVPLERVEEAAPLAPAAFTLTARETLLLLWLAGVAGLIVARSWRSANFRRRLRQTPAVEDPRLQEMIGEQSRRLGLKFHPAVRISNTVNNPALFGLFRPCLIFPAGFAEKLADAELRLVILHELGHWRRRDLLAQAAIQGAQILHWFNPLVWLARRLARLDCELACDEFVLHRTPSADLPTYGATLLKVLGAGHRQTRSLAMLSMLENKQDLKRRIRMISEYRGLSVARTFAGVALLVMLALACATREAWAQAPVAAIVAPPSALPDPVAPPARGEAFDRAAAMALLVSPGPASIPVSDVTHLVVVIDASGSMRDPVTDRLWAAVILKLDEVIKAAPQLQFFQICDADGRTMLEAPEFSTPWVPNRPELVAAAEQAVRNYAKDNTSNPASGIFQALQAIKSSPEPIVRASIWVLGDEISARQSMADVLERLDQVNPPGPYRIPINAVWIGMVAPTNPHLKYISLMSEVARRSGGIFLAAPASVMKGVATAPIPQNGGAAALTPARPLSPEEEQQQKQRQEQLAQERAYQQERSRILQTQALAKANLDTELRGLDPLRQFNRLMEMAQQAADKAEFTAAVRFYNDAMALKPADLSVSETIMQLKATLQAQSAPIEITVRSDGMTNVFISNFKQLGKLETQTLKILPGNYEVVGLRSGYEVVRLPLKVRGDTPTAALFVACTVPIPNYPASRGRSPTFGQSTGGVPDIVIHISDQDTVYWNKEIIGMGEVESRLNQDKSNAAKLRIFVTVDEKSKFDNIVRVLSIARKAGVVWITAGPVAQLQQRLQQGELLGEEMKRFREEALSRIEYNRRLEVVYGSTIQDLIAHNRIASGVTFDAVRHEVASHLSQLQRTSQDEQEYRDRLEVLYEDAILDLMARHQMATESEAEARGIITIDKAGVVSFNRAAVTDDQLLAGLQKLYDTNQNLPVLIKADVTAPWQRIVFVMEACRKAGLKKFSLQSQ